MASLEELTAGYPVARVASAETVRQARSGMNQVLVVLDDDPTGTQSVADLPVLTAWEEEDFRWAFSTGAAAVYVMTNSRSLDPAVTEEITRSVVVSAAEVAADMGLNPVFVSRSDSTLRGHFPLETDVIADASGQQIDGVVLVPAFDEAGRITVGGIHYCKVGGDYLPVGETEFANDATFGYRSSRLAEWVEEKTEGRISASEVVGVSLDTLRTSPEKVLEAAMGLRDGGVLTCDIVNEDDMRCLSLALLAAEASGRKFVYRVGPPFVRARIGQEKHAPVTSEELIAARDAAGAPDRNPVAGGLIVVGSHVGVTQRQLANLKENVPATVLEIDVAQVIDGSTREAHLVGLIDRAGEILNEGSVIVQTSRKLVKGADGDASLDISRQVSAAVVLVVNGILRRVTPAFVLAKGGITSSDVASKGLEIRHALAIGPMLPGIVSLWMAQDGPALGIPYIVFPGNVGDDTSLTAVVKRIQETR